MNSCEGVSNMSMKINPPEFSGKGYEKYKLELLAWNEVTSLDKAKRAIAIALSLPEDDESGLREKIFDEMARDELKADGGFDALVKFMDEKLSKDDLADSLEKFEDFEDFKKQSGQSIVEYIAKFDQKYQRIQKKGLKLPSEILAFKLLRNADLTRAEKMLVLTGMDYSQKDTLYDQGKKSLKKFKGDQATGGC